MNPHQILKRTGSVCFVAVLQLAAGLVFCGRLDAQSEAKYTPEELRRYFKTTAEAYEIQAGDQKLTLRKTPLMNWKNPLRTQSQGALYVWEHEGRPHVLGSIFTYEYRDVVRCRHELISLSPKPLTAKLDSDVVWSPNRPGLQWKEMEKVLVPAETAPRRLFQMRSIARRFTGTLTSREGAQSNLTLIPQPLLRYEDFEAGVIDGAIFSLALGTDPEILLAIEATRSDDAAGFRYAPMRANYLGLNLELDGNEVWQVPVEIELMQTRAGQKPWCDEPFFPMTPSQPLPSPEELR